EDETAAASVGIHVTRFKMGITMLSAGLTAIGGVAYAQYITYVNPDTLAGIGVSLRIVFAVVLGGMYSLLGPTVGTALTIAPGEHWLILCLLPRERVEASPYQRDLSPAHVKRLTETIKRLDRFVDPIVVISPKPGVYWTPNGNHRRAVLDKLRVERVPAILVVEPEMVFEVLPLNVEKAHNLKEKSLRSEEHTSELQ